METILIATDFSPASKNALLYGAQLGEAMNAKVILFHAYTIPALLPAFTIGISNYGVMTEIKEQLNDYIKSV